MKKTNLKISGMHCASCSLLIERGLGDKQGIKNISVNLASNSANVFYDENIIDLKEISKEINKLGYKVVQEIDNSQYKIFFRKFIISLILGLPMIFTMFFDIKTIFKPHIFYIDLGLIILGSIVVLIIGFNFHVGFIKKLLKLQANMDTLISIGTLLALVYSIYAFVQVYWFDNMLHFYHFLEGAVFIITFITLGKYLEIKSKGNASQAIQKLLQLQTKDALIIKDGVERKISVDDLKIGDVVLVKSGDKISVDGKILQGQANIDESMLTGESIPINKKKADNVFSGTIVQNGVLNIEVIKEQSETVLAKIIEFVNNAQNSKAPIQHLVDKISSVFVPVIIVLAIVVSLIWYFYTGDVQKSLLIMVSMIVIACPCAMGLATPMATMVASGNGASKGILIKSGESLEKSKNVDVVIFDKTGTLTEGKPTVTDVIDIDYELKDILLMVYSLTKNSNHPLSTAINNYMTENNIEVENLNNFEEISGKGLSAQYKNKSVLFGNRKLLADNNIIISDTIQKKVEDLQEHGKTVNYISYNGNIIGLLALLDKAKKGTIEGIKLLNEMGIDTVMISGDTQNTVRAIANNIGIENFYAEIHPEGKADIVKTFQDQGKVVAFVGDGINDAPALAQSDLGIAIGIGTDVAIETAEIVLVQGDPYKVVEAIKLSRKTYKIIKQNLFWAFAYNGILVPVAGLGLLLPMFAGLAMSVSSVSVVLNSLRLKRI
ncbi:heavy metal translocating P-type ATPase [Candidatus Gracilibacteria bacterium]|nr:heavy metal translocating P-type ATPase [Candidatus Gracilibacteria bacterium]